MFNVMYVIILNYEKGELIKIKLTEEQRNKLDSCDNEDEFISELGDKYNFHINNCEWMITFDYKERVYGEEK